MRDLSDLPESYLDPAWASLPIPHRPWWVQARVPAGSNAIVLTTFARRRDEVTVVLPPWPAHLSREDRARQLAAACAARDEEGPLARPPRRVGQVWGRLIGAVDPSWSFVQVLAEGSWTPWETKNSDRMLNGADRLLREVLLLDPLRPGDAPWSSQQT